MKKTGHNGRSSVLFCVCSVVLRRVLRDVVIWKTVSFCISVFTVLSVEPTLDILCIICLYLDLHKINCICDLNSHSVEAVTVWLVIFYEIMEIIRISLRVFLRKCSCEFF